VVILLGRGYRFECYLYKIRLAIVLSTILFRHIFYLNLMNTVS